MKKREIVFFRRTSVSVSTNHSAGFWEPSQLFEKSIRHALLRQLHVKNVVGIDIQRDLALTFSP